MDITYVYFLRLIFSNNWKKNKIDNYENCACKRFSSPIRIFEYDIHLFRHFELRSVSKLASQVIFAERLNNRFLEKYIWHIFIRLIVYFLVRIK